MEFKWIDYNNIDMKKAKDIRIDVFITEQKYDIQIEFDEIDKTAKHVIGYSDGVAMCTARVFYENPKVLHCGRVAVLKKYRGMGAGALLLSEVQRHAEDEGDDRIELGAQVPKKGFYEKQGYIAYGDEFPDGGTPHIMMSKILKKKDLKS